MNETGIEWADKTWSPTRGCSRVSPGCEHCYAERIAARFSGDTDERLWKSRGIPFTTHAPFGGFARSTPPRWTGRVELIESKLTEPLHRRRSAEKFLREHGRKPLVFVDSMSDLLHEKLSDKAIHRAFAVMAESVWFDFVVLTKRVERLLAICQARPPGWVLPHVRLGVSVEDRQRADERLPHLMKVEAMGWVFDWKTVVSFEPLLSAIELTAEQWRAIGWAIIGGESGPGARPCELVWIRSLRDQAKAAAVPCFVKQLGSHIVVDGASDKLSQWRDDVRVCGSCDHGIGKYGVRLTHPRGADIQEWPMDLRVQEYP